MNTSTHKYLLYFIILILLFPALLINLGLMPVNADEATRAIVALEMQYSGNYLIPTINGELYFNKPPLYNWMLAGIFQLTGSASELILRIPTVFFLLLFGMVIILTLRKHTGDQVAIASALAFITAGRILFYDSMLGLIDTSFSMLIFLNFIVLFHIFTKKRTGAYFLLSYLLIGTTFLMKGLPSLVFQGLSLCAAGFFFKDWKRIFSLAHVAGVLLFLIIAGSYYYLLSHQNPAMEYIGTLFSESAKRTFMEHGWKATVLNLFTFPFEQIYHLLPWSIFVLFFFDKSFYRRIRENRFLSFLSLIFLVNIMVYWISVEDYPRYMFMLYPVLFILWMDYFIFNINRGTSMANIASLLLKLIILIPAPAMIIIALIYPFQLEKEIYISLAISFPLLLLVSLLAFRKPAHIIEYMIIMLLLLRIVFNFTIIPEREFTSRASLQRQMALDVATIAGEEEIKVQHLATCSHETTYYITRETGRILNFHRGEFLPGSLYIFDGSDTLRAREQILYRFETRWENSALKLSKFKEVP